MKSQIVIYGALGVGAFLALWLLYRPAPMNGPMENVVQPVSVSESPTSRRSSAVSSLAEPHSQGAERREHPVQEEPIPLPVVVDEWAAYEASTAEELIVERDQLRTSLNAECTPLLWTQVRRGRAEFIAEPGEFQYNSRPEDRTELHGILNDQQLGVFRASLSRQEYPDLYEVKDRIDRLSQLIAEKSRKPR